jgi:hypothetical protein
MSSSPSYEDVKAMFDEVFEPCRYGSVPLSVATAEWSEYSREHDLDRGSAITFIRHFASVARSRNRRAKQYGFKMVVGVRKRVR